MGEGSRMATKDINDLQVCMHARDMDIPRRARKSGQHLIERLMTATGECEKVCYCAAERAVGRGLIDYGVSVRQAWVTKEGYELIASQADRNYRNLFNRWLTAVEG